MKNKAKKTRVWCTQKEVCVNWLSTPINCVKIGNQIRKTEKQVGFTYTFSLKGKLVKRPKMVPGLGVKVEKLPNSITCPQCKRRLTPRVREGFDAGDWYVYIPPHKKEVTDTTVIIKPNKQNGRSARNYRR